MSSVSHVRTRMIDTTGAYVALGLRLALTLLVFAMELVTKTFKDLLSLLPRKNTNQKNSNLSKIMERLFFEK